MAQFQRPINISDVLPAPDRHYPFRVRWEEALGGPETLKKCRRFPDERLARRFRRRLKTKRRENIQARRREVSAQ